MSRFYLYGVPIVYVVAGTYEWNNRKDTHTIPQIAFNTFIVSALWPAIPVLWASCGVFTVIDKLNKQ
jgi:hypothetical protein